MKDKGSLNLIREINTSIILDILKEKAPLSKYDISKLTGLSAPTVSNIVNDLVKVGFVKETGVGESIGGRPPLLLDLNLEGGFIIGVDIGSDNIKAIVVDFLGNIIAKSEIQVNPDDSEFIVLDKITLAISTIIEKSKKDRSLFLGMGMGVAGEVDSLNGIIKHASRLKWHNVPLKSIIENSFRIPAYIDENVKLLTFAEQWYGAGKGYNNIVCIRVGDDIGAGIIIDGKLFNGSSGKAGVNIGHLIVKADGPKCECGNSGCLQSLVSSNAIILHARNLIKTYKNSSRERINSTMSNKTANISLLENYMNNQDKLSVEIIAKLAREGDKISIQIMNETSKYLAIAISNIVNCLDPEIVIIGGGIAEAGDVLFNPLQEYLKSIIKFATPSFKVVKSKLGVDAFAMGAATAVLHQIFQSPGKFIEVKNY
ncbi:MAG: ROK family transcriptional regulator [Firmicutes bacterium]|nr:ROK family transcriptional regulator [Bacillota bacterium]